MHDCVDFRFYIYGGKYYRTCSKCGRLFILQHNEGWITPWEQTADNIKYSTYFEKQLDKEKYKRFREFSQVPSFLFWQVIDFFIQYNGDQRWISRSLSKFIEKYDGRIPGVEYYNNNSNMPTVFFCKMFVAYVAYKISRRGEMA